MEALLKLIPFRDYLYAAIAIAAVILYNVHVTKLEHSYAADKVHAVEAADAAATKKANDAAEANIATLTSHYEANLKKVNEQYAANTQVTAAANAADISRLRQLAASYQHDNAVLRSAVSASAPDGRSDTSTGSLGTVPAELGAELAGALRAERDALVKCYAERDGLGK